MSSRLKNGLLGISLLAMTAGIAFSAGPGESVLRKMKLGDKMPEFSLADSKGKVYEYKHGRRRVLAIVFLSPGQEQSKNAVSDIRQLLADPSLKTEPVDMVGVVTRPPEDDLFVSDKDGGRPVFPILLDTEYKLWGKLGIIAMPTVLIIGKDDAISWIRAGHAYDFAPALDSHLKYVLGMAGQEEPDETVEPKPLNNDTAASRIGRHLQMARMLAAKGRLDPAIAEVHKAQALDPNSAEPVLVLGELLCKAGKGEAALEAIRHVKASQRSDQAGLILVSGWANRLIGDLPTAEKYLLEAAKFDPRSVRVHFELGRVLEAKGDKDKALEAYRHALKLALGDN